MTSKYLKTRLFSTSGIKDSQLDRIKSVMDKYIVGEYIYKPSVFGSHMLVFKINKDRLASFIYLFSARCHAL